jgi:hypothetical protein
MGKVRCTHWGAVSTTTGKILSTVSNGENLSDPQIQAVT